MKKLPLSLLIVLFTLTSSVAWSDEVDLKIYLAEEQIKKDKIKAEDKIKKETMERRITQARIDSQNNPGFRDLKPGIHYVDYFKKCSNSKCYGIQNISFDAHFRYKDGSKVLSTLILDMGPISSDGILIDLIKEFADPDANIFRKMKTNFDTKYALDFEFSERDRQLFNEKEKRELLGVYSNGQVVLKINRKERENSYSEDLWLYIEYRDVKSGKLFLKGNRPVAANLNDF